MQMSFQLMHRFAALVLLFSLMGCSAAEEMGNDSDANSLEFEPGIVVVGLRHTEPWRTGVGSLRTIPNTSIRALTALGFQRDGSQAQLSSVLNPLRALPYTVDPSGVQWVSGFENAVTPGRLNVIVSLFDLTATREAEFATTIALVGLQQDMREALGGTVQLRVPAGQEKAYLRQLRDSNLYLWVELNNKADIRQFP